MFFSLFKDHSIGRAVFFFLFLIWWTYFAFKSDLHWLAKKKGWEAVAKLTYDEKTEKRREDAVLREERLEVLIDTETLILIERATDFEMMKKDPLFDRILQKPVNDIEFLYTIHIGVVKIHSEENFRMRVSDFP